MNKQKKVDYEKKTQVATNIGITLVLVLLALRLF